MPEIKFNEALKQLKQKSFAPLYFFQGEESYYIDLLTKEIEENALPEEQKSFNQTVVYGRDIGFDTGKLIDLAMRLPMMAEKQVIIVKEAQDLKNWVILEKYLDNPTPSTILVFAHKNKKLDGRKPFTKKIKKQAIFVTSDQLRDYEMPTWVADYVREKGYKIDKKSTELLVEFLGIDMNKIANELEKLFLVLDSKTITPEAIEQNIGISKDYNLFELNNAMLDKNVVKAFRIVDYYKHNPKAGPMSVLAKTLFNLFGKLYTLNFINQTDDRTTASLLKLHPFILKKYKSAQSKYSHQTVKNNLKILSEYDLKGKGLGNGSQPENELLREMVYKLMLT